MRSSKETTRVTPPAFVLDSEHNSSRSFYKNVTSLLATISRKIISTWFCCANVSLTTSLNEYGIKGGDIEGSINGVVSVSVFPSLDKFSKVRTVAGERLCWRGCVEADEISSAKTNSARNYWRFLSIIPSYLESIPWRLRLTAKKIYSGQFNWWHSHVQNFRSHTLNFLHFQRIFGYIAKKLKRIVEREHSKHENFRRDASPAPSRHTLYRFCQWFY